jgi:arsenate reductase
MRAGNPPGWPVCVGLHGAKPKPNTVRAWDCLAASVYFGMDVQIFGVKKNPDTRKALRFFAERRVRTHFVDLTERAASLGELRRFAQKFGVAALIDESSKRYSDRGLRNARMSDDRWLELLANEPMILKMPLVRRENRLTIGFAEAEWNGWLAQP